MNLFYQPKLSEGYLELEPEESLHAVKVLRHQSGDQIYVTDGKGSLYNCTINIIGRNTKLTVINKTPQDKPSHYIHIAFAPTKSSDRTEWFVEKATEIGVQKISFIKTMHGERSKLNLERIIKVSVAAMKQSGQYWLPDFQDLQDFKHFLRSDEQQKFIAHVDKSQPDLLSKIASKNKSYLLLVGPEGDFSNDEIKAAKDSGFKSVSLGANVLRSETAGVVGCHILSLIQQLN